MTDGLIKKSDVIRLYCEYVLKPKEINPPCSDGMKCPCKFLRDHYNSIFVEKIKDFPSELYGELYDEEWRKSHFTISYNQGFVDGIKLVERSNNGGTQNGETK